MNIPMKPNFLHIKSKYYPIGQGGSANVNTGGEQFMNMFKAALGADAEEVLAKIEKYVDGIDGLNGYSQGLNKASAVQEAFYGQILNTSKGIGFLEQHEKEYQKTLRLGSRDIIRRRDAYLSVQEVVGTTNAEMTAFMETMEKSAPLYGKLMAEMAKSKDPANSKAMSKAALFIESQATAMRVLSDNTNLSADQMNSLAGYSAANGTTLGHQVASWEAIAQSINPAMDKSVAFNMITEGIADAGADIRSQYGKLPGNLESAILKSKKLGLSLKDLAHTGESLLDIESSVSNELEYQQLTGKRLVDENGASLLNMFREATLSGDMDKQANVMNKILETQQEVINSKNPYGKQALAATLGMTVEQLMAMQEQKKVQEQIASIGSKYSTDVQTTLNSLKGISPEDFAKIEQDLKVQLGDDFKAVADIMTNKFAADESMKTPAERIHRFLENMQQTGLLVKIKAGDGLEEYFKGVTNDMTKMQKQATSEDNPIVQLINKLMESPATTKALGTQQIKGDLLGSTMTLAGNILKALPLISQLGTFIQDLGTKAAAILTGQGLPDYSGGVGSTTKVKDAILFDENDQLKLVAGPYGSINEKTAETILEGQQSDPESNTSAGVFNYLFSPDELEQLGVSQEEMIKLANELNSLLLEDGLMLNDDVIKTIEQPGPLLDMLTNLFSDTSSTETPDDLGTIMPYDSGLGTILSSEETLDRSAQSNLEEMMGLTETAPDELGTSMPYDPATAAELEKQWLELKNEMISRSPDELAAEFQAESFEDQMGIIGMFRELPSQMQAHGLGHLLPENADAEMAVFADELQSLVESTSGSMNLNDPAELESLSDSMNLNDPAELETLIDPESLVGEIAPDDLGTIMPYESGMGTILSDESFNSNNVSSNNNQDIINAIEYGFSEYSKKATALDSRIIQEAIYEGMKQVTITVNIDPMAIHKEIEFRKEK